LSLANGGPSGKAFVAFVQFRNADGDLILPPYEGFSQSPRGMAYFYVAGGEAQKPVATTRPFTPPQGAATLHLELRPWEFRERPRLSAAPQLIGNDGNAGEFVSRAGVHQLAVTSRTRGIAVSLANGHEGGDKAFVVAVRFLGDSGYLIHPPYQGFAVSERYAAYFYAKGGKADAPSATTHPFAAPPGATMMELELHPWCAKERPALASTPKLVSEVPGEPRRRQEASPRPDSPPGGSDAIAMHLGTQPMGSQIAERVESGRTRIIGIVGDSVLKALGAGVVQTRLPYDGYDKDWDRIEPSHLVIDVAQLDVTFGWEHALTLRDPAATVEMAVMLQKARRAGIRTVLVEPEQPHRYPLLSRVAHLFDVKLKPDELQGENLAAVISESLLEEKTIAVQHI
jgi:hypothetical protein